MYHIILDGKYRTNSCTDYRTHSDREFANLKILPPFSQEHIYIYIYITLSVHGRRLSLEETDITCRYLLE